MAALLACLRAVRAPVVHATNTTSVGLMPSAMRSSTRRTFTSFLGAGVGRSSASSDLAALWKPSRAFGISKSFGTRYASTSSPLVSRMACVSGRWNVGAITSVAMLGLGLSLFVRNEEPVKCDTCELSK
ncbi:hypothetical protein DL93DRAFT_2116220 [Clavulina sp. PMI_390]|nr:hypothetical protein DL93DRAFT_2116220 [Clavulina sp. PMI_390]